MITIIFVSLLLFIFIILVSFYLIFMIDIALKGHSAPTSRKTTKSINKIISEQKNVKTFYDLGCAHGLFSCRIKKANPSLCVYGIDNNSIRIFFAKIIAFIFGVKINFFKKDIFEMDLSDADIVYSYLWYDILPLLEKKLQKELKKGAIVISDTSNFPNWEPIDKIITCSQPSIPNFENLFIYKKT